MIWALLLIGSIAIALGWLGTKSATLYSSILLEPSSPPKSSVIPKSAEFAVSKVAEQSSQ